MDTLKQQFIELALEANVLKFGDFTLKSGRKSPYFFNAGLFYQGMQLAQLGYYYAATLQKTNLEYDGLFGPAYKGIPLACTTAMQLAASFETDKPFSYNRKEAKDHGEGGTIVGAPLNGRIVMVDDVITAGTAFRETLSIVQANGATLAGVIVALDRQEKGQGELSAIQEIEETYNIPVFSVITLTDIIEFIQKTNLDSQQLDAINDYRTQYGV